MERPKLTERALEEITVSPQLLDIDKEIEKVLGSDINLDELLDPEKLKKITEINDKKINSKIWKSDININKRRRTDYESTSKIYNLVGIAFIILILLGLYHLYLTKKYGKEEEEVQPYIFQMPKIPFMAHNETVVNNNFSLF